MFFPDGTTPPRTILLKFLDIAENSPGAIAVHCKVSLISLDTLNTSINQLAYSPKLIE